MRSRPRTRGPRSRALWLHPRAGNGILIEGSPTGEMHYAVIWLVNGQTGRLLAPVQMSRTNLALSLRP